MQNDRTRYLVMAIVALILAIVLLRYAHSQVVPDIIREISECEQLRVQNFELKREIIRLHYELSLAANEKLIAQSADYINSLFEQYQIDRTKFELRNGKFHAIQEKTK